MNTAHALELSQIVRNFVQRLSDEDAQYLASFFVEEASGWHPVPLGVLPNLVVNGKSYTIPMATEEASVVEAARFMGVLSARFGGIQTTQMKTITKSQVLIASRSSYDDVCTLAKYYAIESDSAFPQMRHRGAEATQVRVRTIDGTKKTEQFATTYYAITLYVDCRDAMGAHRCTEIAEFVGSCFERDEKGKKISAIVSNEGSERVVQADVSFPGSFFRRVTGRKDAVSLLKAMFFWAQNDVERAVTHNKGIMNGVTAVVLASGNDTRANEAAVHAYACRSGVYQPLSDCFAENDRVTISLEMPILLGTAGLAIQTNLGTREFFNVLTNNDEHTIDAPCLASIVAGVGLVQNLAALIALIGEGIHKGHMALHEKRQLLQEAFDAQD